MSPKPVPLLHTIADGALDAGAIKTAPQSGIEAAHYQNGLAILFVEQNLMQSVAVARSSICLRMDASSWGADHAENPELEEPYLGMRS